MDAGNAIRVARRAEGLSQAQLAELIGSTQPQVSSWERGARSPKVSDLQRIADALERNLRVSIEPRAARRAGGFDELFGASRGAEPPKR